MTDWSKNNWYRHRIGSIGGDSKIGKLCNLYGAKGYAVYFLALEYVYGEGLGSLEIEAMATALKMDAAEVESILDSMETICQGLLYRGEDGKWHSAKANKLSNNDEAKREEKRQKSQEYRRKLRENSDTRKNVPTRSDTSQNALISNDNEDVNNEDVNNLDVNNGEGIVKNSLPHSCKHAALPPSEETVSAYIKSIGRRFSASRFIAYWTARNWMVDGVKISTPEQWKALASRWPEDYSDNRMTHPEADLSSLTGVEVGSL